MYAIRFTDVTKTKHGQRILDSISFEMPAGRVLGLVGVNGAGKSSMLKCLSGLWDYEGRIEIMGRTYDGTVTEHRANESYVIEFPTLMGQLTLMENLRYYTMLRGLPFDEEYAMKLVRIMRMEDAIDKRYSRFSSGMKQKSAIIVSILNKPELLVLDEPVSTLDPVGIVDFRNLILALKEKGISILISSHNLSEVTRYCDDILIINKGKVIKHAPVSDGLEQEFFDLIGGEKIEI